MSAPADFLAGGGEMGALMRSRDWSKTPLGPVEGWPQSLRSALSILLPSKAQIALFWGPELITLYNDAYRPVFGGKHPNALGQPIREAWRELWPAGLKELFENVLATGEAFWARDRPFLMERNGFAEETFFDISYDPVRDESGRVGGIFCIVSETTGRILGERRLKVLRDLAAAPAHAHSVPDARALSLAVLAANPADVAFADIDLEQREGWPGREGCHVFPAGEQGGRIALAPSPRLRFDAEYQGFFALVAGQVASSLAAARAVEEERRRAEALAEIDRAKTAFFSNVSHEFRTPLTLMLGPLEDALGEGEAPLPPAQRERLELARRNGLRLQKLVNTLLDFSRIEAGRAQASYEPVDLAELTADLASSFRSAMEKAGLALRVDCAPLPGPAYVDREMWEKIVLNLLSNAFKFTFEGEVAVALRAADGRITLTVRDTGVGIPAAELPQVFERFRRVEGARSRTHEGTGIGLSLVRELVRMHQGSIAAESVEGRGSTFTVTIPAGKDHLPAERIGAARALASTSTGAAAHVEEAARWLPVDAPEADPAERGPRPCIVWADDNADMREYVRRLLGARYDVLAVADGEAALAAVRSRAPALVLADVMMPRLDGFGLLAALRADARTRQVPVILLSARAGEEARVEGLQAGADDYIVKPFSARELLGRVEARLELAAMRARIEEERADFARLFAQTPVPTAVLRGADLVFEMCNAAYIEVVGGRNVVGKPFLEALPEARGQGYDDLLLQVMRTGVPYVGRERLARLERRGRLEDTYFTFIYAPLRSESGAVDRVIAIVNEVTEQVTARQRIEALAAEAGASEARLRAIVETTPECVKVVAADGTLLQMNASGLAMVGASSADAVLGRCIYEVIAPEDRARFRAFNEAVCRGEGGVLEFDIVGLAGERRNMETHAVPLPLAEGVLAQLAITRDVTERRAAAGALRSSEQRYRAVVESQTEMVCRFRPDGTLLFVNGAYARARGTTPEALCAASFWDHIPPADHEGVRAMLARLTPEAPEIRIENRLETVEGERWTLWANRALAFDAQGRVVEAQATGIDITERKRAEEVLREADRRKDEFLAILSHELRNPLAPIRNAVTLLGEASHDPEVRAQALPVLERQVAHLIRLVEDLLDVSRIGRGDVGLQRRVVRVSEVLAAGVETSRPRIEAAGHALSVEQPDPGLAVEGDPVRLAQVVGNLLNNAAAYTEPGGRIEVRVRAEAGEAAISVRDNGMGMSSDDLASLFGMFRRGEAAKNHPSGFGIGLALSRRLAEMHGGSIDAVSQGPGKGSEFILRLPLALPEAEARSSARGCAPGALQAGAQSPPRILVVDDNRDAADSLGLLLRTLGAEVRVAHGGAEALAAFDAHEPSIVVLDVGMPDISGYDVAREIRSRRLARRPHLVALTGWGHEDDRRRAREAGFDDHLVKPAEIGALEALLASLRQ